MTQGSIYSSPWKSFTTGRLGRKLKQTTFHSSSLLNWAHGKSPSSRAQTTLVGLCTHSGGAPTPSKRAQTCFAPWHGQPWCPQQLIWGDSPCWLPVCLPAWISASPGHWLRRSPGSRQPHGTWGCWQAPWHYLGGRKPLHLQTSISTCFPYCTCWNGITWKTP